MKHWIKRFAALCGAVVLSIFGAVNLTARADETQMETVLNQVKQLQQLASDYLQENQQAGDALVLAINYIRAERYSHFTWDMILGTADPDFSAYVQQAAPDLKELQRVKRVQTGSAQEQVDFVHLIAGIGATYRRMPIICTWGGDCIQLAESIKGSSGDEEGCIKQLEPYFASQDENASLFPQSDWLADLDGVNIGSSLQKEEDLAQKIQQYYSEITPEKRAVQFVQTQFGAIDTQNTEEFRNKVKQTFQNDSGVQLFLMTKEYMTLDEEKNGVIVPEMEQPLHAVCSLMADELARLTQNAQSDAAASEPKEDVQQSSPQNSPQEEQFPEKAQPTGEKLDWLWLMAAGGMAGFAAILLIVLLRKK